MHNLKVPASGVRRPASGRPASGRPSVRRPASGVRASPAQVRHTHHTRCPACASLPRVIHPTCLVDGRGSPCHRRAAKGMLHSTLGVAPHALCASCAPQPPHDGSQLEMPMHADMAATYVSRTPPTCPRKKSPKKTRRYVHYSCAVTPKSDRLLTYLQKTRPHEKETPHFRGVLPPYTTPHCK